MEFLGHEEEGWYSGQLKGQTGVFPSNYVELSSPVTVSSVSTTDGKQLSSVAVSEIRFDKPFIPIPKVGGAGTPNHDDPTPPTSAGETECLSQCMRLFTYLLPSFADVRGMSVDAEGGEDQHSSCAAYFGYKACSCQNRSQLEELRWESAIYATAALPNLNYVAIQALHFRWSAVMAHIMITDQPHLCFAWKMPDGQPLQCTLVLRQTCLLYELYIRCGQPTSTAALCHTPSLPV